MHFIAILHFRPYRIDVFHVIGRYERGDITPSIEAVAKIADTLEVSFDYLIGTTILKRKRHTRSKPDSGLEYFLPPAL